MRKDKNNRYEVELYNEETGEEIQIDIRFRNFKLEKEAELIGVFEATEDQMKEILCPSESSPEHQRTKKTKKMTVMEWLNLQEEVIARNIRYTEERISESTEILIILNIISNSLGEYSHTDNFTPSEKAECMKWINDQKEFHGSLLKSREKELPMRRKNLEAVQSIIRHMEERTATINLTINCS